MSGGLATLQIGKNGLTKGVIETIKFYFKTRADVKIHLLKSAGHDKEVVKKMAEEIIKELGNKFTYKILGFTISMKKWRKPQTNK